MRTLSPAQKNHILSRLDAGHSAHSIASTTGIHAFTIFRLHSKECSELQKSIGRRSSKLSPVNVRHAIHLITTQRVENAVQVTKDPQNCHQPAPLPKHSSPSSQKDWDKGCGQEETPFALCQASQVSSQFCPCSQRLDCGGLEESYIV